MLGNPDRPKKKDAMYGDLDPNLDRIRQTIINLEGMLERKSWEGQAKTSGYIKKRIRIIGLEPQVHTYRHNNKEWENVSVVFSGRNVSNSRIVIVAHYDSTSRGLSTVAPGADDNATGVAALFELSHFMGNKKLNSTVQLVFLADEEHGRQGSKAFAKMLRQKNAQLIGVLNVDGIGYNNQMALFSKEIIRVFTGELPIKRKAKMIGKMIFNAGIRILFGKKTLKVVARNEDQHLMPNMQKLKIGDLDERVKWILDDECVSGDEVSFWEEGYSAVTINSLYKNPYAETPEDFLKHIDLLTVSHACYIAMLLIRIWDRKIL